MAERVHPADSPRPSTSSAASDVATKPQPLSPAAEKPPPTPGTYVIQIPKDQIYRVPPPENARRFEQYTRRKHRRSRCCCYLYWLLAIFLILIVLLGIAVAVFYFVVRPKSPNYSIDAIAIRGINSSAAASISPEFDVSVRADNPNKKIGIYYESGSSVQIYFSDVKLSDGVLPAFFQPPKNVTVFGSTLRGTGVNLSTKANEALIDSQRRQSVPLKVEIRAPIKLKIGSVKTWKIRVKVVCDVTVDRLTAAAKIVSKNCDYSVKLW